MADHRTDGRTEHEACHVTPTWRVMVGDVREQLAVLPDASVQMVCTSPPYWGLRDYGHSEQIGLESTPAAFVAAMVDVFAAVRRVLSADGVLWLNLGDSYAGSGKGPSNEGSKQRGSLITNHRNPSQFASGQAPTTWLSVPDGLKGKDLVGIPWRVAFALQADGWYLRADVIWSKPNSMPESIKDRPTKSHEYLFLLTKSERYFYDADAIAEPASLAMQQQMEQGYEGLGIKDYEGAGVQNPSSVKARIIAGARRKNERTGDRRKVGFNDRWDEAERLRATERLSRDQVGSPSQMRSIVSDTGDRYMSGRVHAKHAAENGLPLTRNARSVWTIPTQPYPDAHFATFPELLPERCIKAGSRLGDMVLDPFCGSGTTGQVAIQLGRSFIGIELNPTYAELARKRIGGAAPLFAVEELVPVNGNEAGRR